MTSQTRQISHGSRSDYSQSDYSSDDDATTRDVDHEPATTSDRHPGTFETVTEKAGLLNIDDSDTDNPLAQMLLDLGKTMNDEILKAVIMAKSGDLLLGEACQQTLDEALHRVNRLANRKEYYKNEKKQLEEKKKSLEEELDVLKTRANTLQAEMSLAREKARELFG